MPSWLQILSTVVAASFTIGTLARGIATWVWANTIKRDLADIRAEAVRLNNRIDEIADSDIVGEVREQVNDIETDQKMLKQHVDFLMQRLETLTRTVERITERHARVDDRGQRTR